MWTLQDLTTMHGGAAIATAIVIGMLWLGARGYLKEHYILRFFSGLMLIVSLSFVMAEVVRDHIQHWQAGSPTLLSSASSIDDIAINAGSSVASGTSAVAARRPFSPNVTMRGPCHIQVHVDDLAGLVLMPLPDGSAGDCVITVVIAAPRKISASPNATKAVGYPPQY